jgi:hypothetical protein
VARQEHDVVVGESDESERIRLVHVFPWCVERPPRSRRMEPDAALNSGTQY